MRKAKRGLSLAALASVLALGTVYFVPSAGAHGTGVVKSCLPGTTSSNCLGSSANNAVFAVCTPKAETDASYTCDDMLTGKGPRQVTIWVSNYPASTTVNMWWLNGAVDNPTKSDCTQVAGAPGRTSLGTITTDSTGKGSLDTHLPPPRVPGGAAQTETPGEWSYGTNWICGTTAAPNGTGTIGDQQFAIYPA